nr:HPP family protein [uncultured Desulfuromonas sp.]
MTKRHDAVLMKRHMLVPNCLKRLPKRCHAPLVGPRSSMTFHDSLWSFLSGTFGILVIFWLTELLDFPLLIGSFGASAVLLFGAADSPLAQPRNVIAGHVVSAVVAVCVVALLGTGQLAIAVAVGLAIFVMNVTHTTHPPGGATALIGVQGGAGPEYIVIPVLLGALILLLTALITNNLVYHRKYPKHWF